MNDFSMSQPLLIVFRIIVIEFHAFDPIFEKQVFSYIFATDFLTSLINHSIGAIFIPNTLKAVTIKCNDLSHIWITTRENRKGKSEVFNPAVRAQLGMRLTFTIGERANIQKFGLR